MSVSSKPVKLIIIVAAAAIMVGIALAIVLNYQSDLNALDESQASMPDIEVLTPESIGMQKGETKVIPLEVRILSKEPLDARIWVFSTASLDSAEQETMSNSDNLDEQFQELQQRGFTDGFIGSLDIERFSAPANSDGNATIVTINLTLTAPNDIAAGNYYFAHSVLAKTVTWDSMPSGTLEITIA